VHQTHSLGSWMDCEEEAIDQDREDAAATPRRSERQQGDVPGGTFGFNGPMTRLAKCHWTPVFTVLAIISLGGCGGASSTSSASQTHAAAVSTTTSTAAANASSGPQTQPPPLPAAEARRVASICRHAETSEDDNVIVQFADQGARIYSPSIQAALKHASTDLAPKVRSLGRLSEGARPTGY
jgi:hypothetical protein